MPRRGEPQHDDVVITRVAADRSYLLECGAAPLRTFRADEWQLVRLAAVQCLTPGASVWFVDAQSAGRARRLDIDTGILLDD